MFIPTEPGVYFGLPLEAYLQIKAVGSSSIRDMDISPLDCWAKNVDPEREKKDTKATLNGSAFHAAVLEGMDALTERYFPKFNREAFPDVLFTGEQLKEAADEVKVKKNGTLLAIAERLVDAGMEPTVLGPLVEAEYYAEHEGKQEIGHETWDHILRTYSVMEQARIIHAFQGGEAEVTIVWRNETFGLLCKARIDYLKPDTAFDLKTFANANGRSLRKAVADSFIYGRYHYQGIWIQAALEHFPHLPQFRPQSNTKVENGVYQVEPNVLLELKSPKLFFVFYQTGGVPNVVGREFSAFAPGGVTNNYWDRADKDVALWLREYSRFLAKFGEDRPWIEEAHVQAFDDSDFPPFMLT